MQARTAHAAPIRSAEAGDAAADDSAHWAALRAQAERRSQVPEANYDSVAARPTAAQSFAEPSWEELRARTELEYAFEVNAQRREAQAHHVAAFAAPLPLPPASAPLRLPRDAGGHAASFEPTVLAFEELGDDDFWLISSPARRALPAVACALLCVAVTVTAFTRQLLAEAEHHARVEQTLREIRSTNNASSAAAASGESVLGIGRPQSAAPKSETLAAFLRQSAAAESEPALAAVKRAHGAGMRPSLDPSAPKPQAAAPAVQKQRAEHPKAPEPTRVAPEEAVNLSDDPLFGL